MKINQQVISYESARKLQDLGVTIDTNFRYVNKSLCIELPCSPFYNEVSSGQMISSFPEDEIVMAYTSSELGEMLPKEYIPEKHLVSAGLRWEFPLCKGAWISCEIEAEARAILLIYLLENHLITAEEINTEAANA